MIGPPDILVSQSFPHPNYLQRQKYDTISVTTSLEGVGLNRGYKQAWSVTPSVGWIHGTQIGQGISHRPWTSLDRGTGSAARESPTARMPLAATRSGSPRERSGAPRGFRGPLPRVGMLSLPPPLPFLTAPSKSRRRPPSLRSAYSAGVRWVACGGTNRSDIGLNLSGSWQQGHSATYNTPSRI